MSFITRYLPHAAAALFTLVIGLSATTVFAQGNAARSEKHRDFCSENNWSSNDKVSVRDLREMTVTPSGKIAVDAGRNGGVTVRGEDRSDVLVRACVQAWGNSEDAAKANVANIKINTAGKIKAESSSGDENWSVSYDIRVPRNTDVDLSAHNGGISITSVDGSLDFETTNGGVFLSDVAGEVKGRTTNGGVFVKLSGNTWKGNGLDVTTSNGGVNLELPGTYAARVEAGTVNGGFKSTVPALNVTTEDIRGEEYGRRRQTRISTTINGGGPTIRVMTTNGGVRISTPE